MKRFLFPVARSALVCLTLAWLIFSFEATAARVEVDSDCVEMGAVTWSEKVTNGVSRLTVKATANKGFSFSEWSFADKDVIAWADDVRYPGLLTATVATNAVIDAFFIPEEEDNLSFDLTDVFPEEIACGERVTLTLDVDSVSFPTITFENLPPGLLYDSRTLTVLGMPTEPGVYRIEATAVNGSGYTFRSFATMRVLGIDGARVAGNDIEIGVDEYWFAEPDDLFSFSEEPSREEPGWFTLTAAVPGLTWNEDWQLLYGTPTEPGEYVLKALVRFPTGTVEKATIFLTVAGADPEDFDIDLEPLVDLQAGDSFDETTEIGVDTAETKITRVSGLPTGLKAKSSYESNQRRWYLSGTVRAPGFFNVVVEVENHSDETQRIEKIVKTVCVGDLPDVYLKTRFDETQGTVVGGGPIAPYADVTLEARPRSGFVFSGWYDSSGEKIIWTEGVDYRTPKVTLSEGADYAFVDAEAHFVAQDEDVAPDLSDIEGVNFVFAPDEPFSTTFQVESYSLPELSFDGLPAGMTSRINEMGEFALEYDPTSEEAKSGRYILTVTAVNQSGAKAVSEFGITVGNRTDARIHVADDYGELTPDEEMEAISLAGAVDFSKGETLSVSGLPRGISYNSRANDKKGIAAYTLTGTPTVPGEYTVTFTAKVVASELTNKMGKVTRKYEKASATAFLTVLPYPAIEIDLDEDLRLAGCKVSGAGNYKPGSSVTLKASPAKGYVFAGWLGLDELDDLQVLSPRVVSVSGSEDLWLQADFMPICDDWLSIDQPLLSEAGFAAEWPLKEELDETDQTLIADLVDTGSWPTVTVAGLPSGIKFASQTFRLSGRPTKSGIFHVTVTAKNAGGYSFVRMFDLAVLTAEGKIPADSPLSNAAKIDFSPLNGLTTGVLVPTGSVVLSISSNPETGAAVKKVTVKGFPSGLSAIVQLDGQGGATVEVIGTPIRPARQEIAVTVSYVDATALKSQAAIVVEDGGSRYLFVAPDDEDRGVVTGEGVYSAGATVKLVAKAKSKNVFAGWCASDGDLFAPLRDQDGIDPRRASVTFLFRPEEYDGDFSLVGSFCSQDEDAPAEIVLAESTWEIDPSAESLCLFEVDSMSVPTVNVSGLPKGVTVDSVRGEMTYEPSEKTTPGIYTAQITAKNVSQSKATEKIFSVYVKNRSSEIIGGLDSDENAYPLTVGAALNSEMIVPDVGADWKLTVQGLPSGLSFQDGTVSGVPTKAGDYTVTFKAVKGKGKSQVTEIATITLRISELPSALCGSFTGLITDEDGAPAGSVAVTASSSGKTTVSLKTATQSSSFSASSWKTLTNGVISVEMTSKNGDRCLLSIRETNQWREWTVSGRSKIDSADLEYTAQRNPFEAKDGNEEAQAIASKLQGSWQVEGWTLKISKNGKVSVIGKYAGQKVSGSSIVQFDSDLTFVRYVFFDAEKSCVSMLFLYDSAENSWSCKREQGRELGR